MKTIVFALVVALATGCGHRPTDSQIPILPPNSPEARTINAFVAATDLPDKQPYTVMPVGDPGAVWSFRVSYGSPHDCDSGCFYSAGYGLLNNGKIAWFDIRDYDGRDMSHIPKYELDSNDYYLFQPELWRSWEASDPWFYRLFLHRLANSTKVGAEPLARVAYTLFAWIDPSLARDLIANPVVRANRDILFTLAGLPQPAGDAYAQVREEARTLLGLGK